MDSENIVEDMGNTKIMAINENLKSGVTFSLKIEQSDKLERG